MKKKLAIFASGRGSNAQKIYEWSLKEESSYEVAAIITNKKEAGILQFAKEKGILSRRFSKKTFNQTDEVLEYLFDKDIDFVALAGFLLLVPQNLIDAFPKRMTNIHPALLPNYGGKGMYGSNVHEAVAKNKDDESGMTIHFVNEKYDDGNMIFQAQCQLTTEDSAKDIAAKVLKLEHHFYPKVLNGVVRKMA